jgi:hypothetical protein
MNVTEYLIIAGQNERSRSFTEEIKLMEGNPP